MFANTICRCLQALSVHLCYIKFSLLLRCTNTALQFSVLTLDGTTFYFARFAAIRTAFRNSLVNNDDDDYFYNGDDDDNYNNNNAV